MHPGKRRAISLAIAIAAHAALLAFLIRVQAHDVHAQPTHITITFAHPSTPTSSSTLELHPTPTPAPPPPSTATAPSSPPHAPSADDNASPPPASPENDEEAARTSEKSGEPQRMVDSTGHIFMPENAPHVVHHDVVGDSIRGATALDGPQPSLATLEAGSALKVHGPESDAQRLARETREQ